MKRLASPNKLALVLSGGGARGAYEAGVLHYLRTMLPPAARQRAFDIYCGASVGAINSCFMAATAHDQVLQARELWRLWETLREEDIFQRNLKALFSFLTQSGKGLLVKLLRGSGRRSPHFPGFFDTSPFLPFINRVIPWKKISSNLGARLFQALSIVATNVFTGRMELFIEKSPELSYTGDHIVHLTSILPEHAKASAAIPVIFPTVLLDGIPYTDGGLRLNTPLSPAIHLGADAILVIQLNHRAKAGETIPCRGERGRQAALGQVLGRVMNSVFLDKVQYDLEQLERINQIIAWGEKTYGETFVPNLGHGPQPEQGRTLKQIKIFRIRPSLDTGEMFYDCLKKTKREHFTVFEKFLIRFWDVDPQSGTDFLSYIAFLPTYLKRLLELGFEDAKSQHASLKEFLTC